MPPFMDIRSLAPPAGRMKCVWVRGADGRLESIWVPDRDLEAEILDEARPLRRAG